MIESWWCCLGDRVYHLNPQSFFRERTYHAITIQPKPFLHRNMYYSRVTGEQVHFEVVKPIRRK